MKKKKTEKGKKPQPEETANGKKKGGKKKFLLLIPLVLVVAAAAMFVLKVGPFASDESTAELSEKEQEELNERYYIYESDKAPAFDTVLNRKTGGVRAAVLQGSTPVDVDGQPIQVSDLREDMEDEEEEAATTSADESGLPESVTYVYLQLESPHTTVKEYVRVLTAADPPFAIHGAEPDYEADHGTISLVRVARELSEAELNSNKKKKTEDEESDDTAATSVVSSATVRRFWVEIEWGLKNCLVTLSMQDNSGTFAGSMTEPPLSYSMAKSMMYTVTPAELGLAGESMTEYEIIPGPGLVSINNEACMKVNVYGTNKTGTNQISGTYFISEKTHELYRQIGDSTNVEKIELTADVPLDYQEDSAEGEEGSEGTETPETEESAEGEEESKGGIFNRIRNIFKKDKGDETKENGDAESGSSEGGDAEDGSSEGEEAGSGGGIADKLFDLFKKG